MLNQCFKKSSGIGAQLCCGIQHVFLSLARSAAEAFGITSLSAGAEAMEPLPHCSTQTWELFLFQTESQNQAKVSGHGRWGFLSPAGPGGSPGAQAGRSSWGCCTNHAPNPGNRPGTEKKITWNCTKSSACVGRTVHPCCKSPWTFCSSESRPLLPIHWSHTGHCDVNKVPPVILQALLLDPVSSSVNRCWWLF